MPAFPTGLRYLDIDVALDISKTRVESLAPLSSHPVLELVRADGTPIAALPSEPIPQRRIVAYSSA